MELNSTVMRAVEQLDYRVTAGDVAAHTGLDVKLAQQDLLALASAAGGHLQVSESGDIAYQFSQDFRGILRNKFWQLRLQSWWKRIWGVLFYLIRISFGVLLLVSIVLIVIAIILIWIAANSSRQNQQDSRSSGGMPIILPRIWIGGHWFRVFDPHYSYYHSRRWQSHTKSSKRRRNQDSDDDLNFLEAVFSFLFGDGDPNADREERRWQTIATVIRNHRGAVAAEQIAPYLDDLGQGSSRENEDYMLPVLIRFNGQPEVSPQGQLVYFFPELQVSANKHHVTPVPTSQQEALWTFSRASASQKTWAIGLGLVNVTGAVYLGMLLRDGTIAAELGGLVAFVSSIYWVLLAYGISFLAIPVLRYLWLKWRNRAIANRNEQRQARAIALEEADDETLQHKISYARQFAAETIVRQDDLAYTTESDLVEQEAQQKDKIDAEWQRRLNS